MNRKVQIGFIGAGAFISAHHLKTAGETPFIEIRAIADLNEELLAAHKAHYDIGYTTGDYRKLLEDDDIDLIVIGTRQDTHAKLIVEALDAGKWVWCEKPMCEKPEEEDQVIAAEKRARGRLAIGFNRRFAPAIQEARRLLEKLPRPWIINYLLQSNGGYKARAKDTFYHERPHIIYEGCHILDLATYIMGAPPKRVFMSGTEDENDIVILEYPDGSRFVLVITSHAGANLLEKEAMEILTPGGAISLRDFIDMRVRGIPGEHDRLFLPERTPYGPELQKWGYSYWEALTSRFVEPDIDISPGIVPVKLAQTEQPFLKDIEAAFAPHRNSPWQMRNFVCDKGWIDAFRHFAKAFLEGSKPMTADGQAGKLANDIGFTLLQSKKTGIPKEFAAISRIKKENS
ncbi:MAG: Gfo/Idh/MocA family oxidoreductase [Victivallales bacterium]|nr:Gfo/Idh/MocA family oxidoreductase [Victivallales bacterium]